ncbi:sulfite exporter TauE/SafE family protein [Actinomycetospora straminea]|uniref:Probable membrane transporter protein n=1 Tax=Actinomycetospora straminea TaxID=663607 RepID=A0ABP9EA12_9PSEU|nr:sulfite exporter TauE/SafE family protein [Actinomycetospora straminea]MDD7931931.1 sulfite exporter TauE/SafE family protein [Actinomycetospora straminea]
MTGLAALFGAVIGALLGLVGGGGGILAVPALVYGLGFPVSAAVPASLVVIGLTSAVAVAPRVRREVNWRLAAIVGAAGIPTALLGGVVNHRLDQDVLLVVFAAIMILAAVRMLRGTDETGGVCDLPDGGVAWRRCLPRAMATGLLVGFLTGLLGVGGGFLLVPALIIALGLRTPIAVATSLVIMVINSAAGLVPHLASGGLAAGMDWPVIAVFALAAFVVSLPAGRLARRVPAAVLRRGFAVLVLLVAAGVTTRSLTTLIA